MFFLKGNNFGFAKQEIYQHPPMSWLLKIIWEPKYVEYAYLDR